MKRVAFISSDRVLAQGGLTAMREQTEVSLQCFPVYRYEQPLVDVEALSADAVILDLTGRPWSQQDSELCRALHTRRGEPCRCLLLIRQDTEAAQTAVLAK